MSRGQHLFPSTDARGGGGQEERWMHQAAALLQPITQRTKQPFSGLARRKHWFPLPQRSCRGTESLVSRRAAPIAAPLTENFEGRHRDGVDGVASVGQESQLGRKEYPGGYPEPFPVDQSRRGFRENGIREGGGGSRREGVVCLAYETLVVRSGDRWDGCGLRDPSSMQHSALSRRSSFAHPAARKSKN